MQFGPLSVVAMAAALGACSGEAEPTRLSAGGSAHAGAASHIPATPRYPTGGGAGGTAGVGAVAAGGAAGVAAAVSGGAGGADAASGGVGGESTADLSVLAGNVFLYHITHELQSDNIGDWPEDSDYVPVDVDTQIWATFSTDATQLQLIEAGVADPVNGVRMNVVQDRVQYELDLFAAGHFDVWVDGPELAAEYTINGSGVPVISSTRGVLVLVDP